MNTIRDLLIRNNAIEFGDFTLSSGKKSSYYVDIKSVLTKPDILNLISTAIATQYEFDVVAGVAVGGVPLAVAISLITEKPYAIIRSSRKSYGKNDTVIGDAEGKNVLLVEDVTTTGKSALYGAKCLREEGAWVRTVVTVFDREEGSDSLLEENNLCLRSLVKSSDL